MYYGPKTILSLCTQAIEIGCPVCRLVIGSDDERDPEYVPPCTSSPSQAARAARSTPKKVASGVVTASNSNEERTLTGTPSGSATHEEGSFGSLGFFWLEEVFGTANVPDSTPSLPTGSLTPVSDQPNRWCIDGPFQVYSDAKFLNDKGVMTRTLTLERRVITRSLPRMPEIHNLFTRYRLETF